MPNFKLFVDQKQFIIFFSERTKAKLYHYIIFPFRKTETDNIYSIYIKYFFFVHATFVSTTGLAEKIVYKRRKKGKLWIPFGRNRLLASKF